MDKKTETRVYPARLDASGRVVLPVEVRSEMGISHGDQLLIVKDEHGLHVETPEQASAALRAYFKALVPAGVSLADELIAERQAEAERE